MAEPTPADELRQAAGKVREAVAQFGRISPHYPEQWRRELGKLNAPWTALMHPGVAGPLAEGLDAAADLYDANPGLDRIHVTSESCGNLSCRVVTAALATARAINGSGEGK